MNETVQKITDRNSKCKNCEPVLLENWYPFTLVGKSFVFDKFTKKDIPPNGAQTEGDRIENQPEDNVFCCYCGPVFLL